MKIRGILIAILMVGIFAGSSAVAQEKGVGEKKYRGCVVKSWVYNASNELMERVAETSLKYGRNLDAETKRKIATDMAELTLKIEELLGGFVVDKPENCPAGMKVIN